MLACSSMTLKINSEPSNANVYIKDGKKLKKLGVTPLALGNNEISQYQQYNLSIQKEGYQTHEVMIDKRVLSAEAKVFATLKKLTENSNVLASGSNDDTQQRSLASIQAQLIQNNFSQAEILAKGFLNDNPYSPVGWNLLGNAYLLQNQNGMALKAYNRALEFDPGNKDTIKMIEHLQGSPLRRDR